MQRYPEASGGLAEREILSEYPDLEKEDIRECLHFAAFAAAMKESFFSPGQLKISD